MVQYKKRWAQPDQSTSTFEYKILVLWFRFGFSVDPDSDQAFYLYADSDGSREPNQRESMLIRIFLNFASQKVATPPYPPQRTSKLQEKPSAFTREHQALQK
jgi:hypothetical protein